MKRREEEDEGDEDQERLKNREEGRLYTRGEVSSSRWRASQGF